MSDWIGAPSVQMLALILYGTLWLLNNLQNQSCFCWHLINIYGLEYLSLAYYQTNIYQLALIKFNKTVHL